MYAMQTRNDKAAQNDFQLEILTEAHANALPLTYIPCFKSHPWHEEFQCAACRTRPYSLECTVSTNDEELCEEFKSGKVFSVNGKDGDGRCINEHCRLDLTRTLTPIHTYEGVRADYLSACQRRAFIGTGARQFGMLIGFCWGYSFPHSKEPRHSVSGWYEKIAPVLEHKLNGVPLTDIFYHNELAVLREYSGKGIATTLLRSVLVSAAVRHDFVLFKTTNPTVVRCYEKAYETEKGKIAPLQVPAALIGRTTPYLLPLDRFK